MTLGHRCGLALLHQNSFLEDSLRSKYSVVDSTRDLRRSSAPGLMATRAIPGGTRSKLTRGLEHNFRMAFFWLDSGIDFANHISFLFLKKQGKAWNWIKFVPAINRTSITIKFMPIFKLKVSARATALIGDNHLTRLLDNSINITRTLVRRVSPSASHSCSLLVKPTSIHR